MESFPNNNNNINNNEELINNFTSITGAEKEIAIYYLDKAKNNVNTAVTMFFDDTQEINNPSSKNNNNINNNNNIQIDEPIGFTNYPNYNNYHNINNNNNNNNIYNVNRSNNIRVPMVYPPVNNNNNQNNQEEGFFSKYIFKPFKLLFCGKRTNSPSSYTDFMNSQEYLNLMSQIPNLEKNYSIFVEKIYIKIGILIIWNRNTIKDLSQLFLYINKNKSILETIKNNCICYIVKPGEVNRMKKIFNNDYEFIYPTLIFVSNKTNIKSLNKFSELTKMQGMDGTRNLQSILDYSIEEKNKRKNYINNNSIPEDVLFNEFSNGDIIAKQKNDLAELERQVQKKEKEERERKLKEEQEKKLLEEKKNQYLKQIEEVKKKIKPEPNQNDPNSTLIVLRYPNGEQRVERRFLKTDVIEDIYNFVTSLGREIYTENEINGFSIVQPFPPKVFSEMNKTLEEEGLVPNAILQIKEN